MFETTEQVFEMLHGAAIDALERMEAERDTMRARAEAAEAEVERLRAAIAETLRLADVYADVAAHNAEAEPETAAESWRSAGAATVRELRRALGGAA